MGSILIVQRLTILICLLLVSSCSQQQTAPTWPAKKLTWLNTKQPISLGSLHGKVILIDFFTKNCKQCTTLQQTIHQWQQPDKSKFQLIGVYTPTRPSSNVASETKAIIKKYKINFPVMIDPKGSVMRIYSVKVWPTLALINQQGFLIKHYYGAQHPNAWQDKIKKLISSKSSD